MEQSALTICCSLYVLEELYTGHINDIEPIRKLSKYIFSKFMVIAEYVHNLTIGKWGLMEFKADINATSRVPHNGSVMTLVKSNFTI